VGQGEEAWAALYDQYHRLVRRWLGNAPGEPDALVNRVFERFWQALSPERFVDFPTLAKILAYLKRCAQCVAMDAKRQEEREQARETALSQAYEILDSEGYVLEHVLDKLLVEQLHEQVMVCLDHPRERLVFRASFEWNLKPRAIAERWPGDFASAKEVSRIKERILRRLQRNQELLALFEINGQDGGNSIL
jgi:RNA polymerase sigma factor (sigma-70 family)